MTTAPGPDDDAPSGGTPSDRVPDVVGHGETDVDIAVVSLSGRALDGADAAYIEWHALDHLPEQYRITGLRCGTRWVSTPACRSARAASSGHYDAVAHVVAYLFAPPVDAALDTFFALGAALASAGRLPVRLPSVELAGWRLRAKGAAERVLVGADVLPWRPALGVYLLIEDGDVAPDPLLNVPGVAGCWVFDGTGELSARLSDRSGFRLIVCYLDQDPVATAELLRPVLEARWEASGITPQLAAPFVTVVPWAWDRSLPKA